MKIKNLMFVFFSIIILPAVIDSNINMSLSSLPLVSKLSKSVIRILGCNPGVMTLQGTNTYLIGTGKRRILIDSGDEDTSSSYIKHLDAVLKEENATIEHLIITHWHHDHIGGSKAVKNLVESSSDVAMKIWKFPRSSDDDNDTGYPVDNWQHLVDEQLFQVEGAKLKIKYTPGHTTDHACLLLENENILFSGDCILGETTAVFEDLHDYMITLGKLLKLNSTYVYPGHGPVVDDPNVKINYYIEHRKKRETDILNVLKESNDNYLSVADIVAKVYKDKDESLWPAAAKNVNQHLDKLLKENKVKKLNDLWLLI